MAQWSKPSIRLIRIRLITGVQPPFLPRLQLRRLVYKPLAWLELGPNVSTDVPCSWPDSDIKLGQYMVCRATHIWPLRSTRRLRNAPGLVWRAVVAGRDDART